MKSRIKDKYNKFNLFESDYLGGANHSNYDEVTNYWASNISPTDLDKPKLVLYIDEDDSPDVRFVDSVTHKNDHGKSEIVNDCTSKPNEANSPKFVRRMFTFSRRHQTLSRHNFDLQPEMVPAKQYRSKSAGQISRKVESVKTPEVPESWVNKLFGKIVDRSTSVPIPERNR